MLATCPWYLVVPYDRRQGRPGVSYVPWGLLAVRSERLREADFPDLSAGRHDPSRACPDDVLLGEMARQLDVHFISP
jgi:hypothetical protein